MSSQVEVRRIKDSNDLAAICAQMQPDLWGKDNEMTSYQPESLKKFLGQNGILLLAYSDDKIAGALLAYKLAHPDGDDHLYVHELDTHPDFRRQGVGTQLVQEAFKLAKELSLDEVWLGTEHDNEAAKALYQKLGPTEIEHGPTYSYKID
jgi:ribosomal protein S18 acetylase RimI-like enzyme